ncbi:MAG TPA: hypothetical protein VN929_07515 [Burkholderiales bacterium]|nr:hypothetical protein [Burkholderiales bacterium]
MRIVATAVLVLVLLPSAPAARSEQARLDKAVDLLQQQSQTGKGEFIAFINAAGGAYSWVNTELETKEKGHRLFCPPPGTLLTSRDYAQIAVIEYKKGKNEYAQRTEYPLEVLSLALLRGLQDTFPCK